MTTSQPTLFATQAHKTFRDLMLSGSHPCLGGAAAIRRGNYDFAAFGELGSATAAAACADRVAAFMRAAPESKRPVSVFVACFDRPAHLTELQFELLLWEHLRDMRMAELSAGTADLQGRPDFAHDPGFVFAGRNIFVVGLHPAASRLARRFPWPTLVFNALSHADPLNEADKYGTMTQRIRERDLRLQGTPNPCMFAPRVAQFSGRKVSTNWTCPVHLPGSR